MASSSVTVEVAGYQFLATGCIERNLCKKSTRAKDYGMRDSVLDLYYLYMVMKHVLVKGQQK